MNFIEIIGHVLCDATRLDPKQGQETTKGRGAVATGITIPAWVTIFVNGAATLAANCGASVQRRSVQKAAASVDSAMTRVRSAIGASAKRSEEEGDPKIYSVERHTVGSIGCFLPKSSVMYSANIPVIPSPKSNGQSSSTPKAPRAVGIKAVAAKIL
jgi:hypothetical protein